jgi:hypothetical protein
MENNSPEPVILHAKKGSFKTLVSGLNEEYIKLEQKHQKEHTRVDPSLLGIQSSGFRTQRDFMGKRTSGISSTSVKDLKARELPVLSRDNLSMLMSRATDSNRKNRLSKFTSPRDKVISNFVDINSRLQTQVKHPDFVRKQMVAS